MVRAMRTAVSTGALRVISNRGGLAVTAGFDVAVVAVLGSLWIAAAEANGGAVAGYSAAALVWYVAASEAATVSLNTRLIDETGEQIASGTVAVELLRPVPMLAVRVGTEVGAALPRLAVCAVTGFAVAFVLQGAPPDPATLPLAAVSLVLAVTCNLVAQHAFAGVSFWIRDSRATWFIYQKFVFLLGGMLLPIQVLPDAAERAARFLPFVSMAYAPARLASGHLEPALLLVQLVWLGILSVLAARVFTRGEHRLQVVGG